MRSPFPRFKTFLEGIFWDLFELRRRSHFDGIDVRKMGSLQNRFDLREEKKVTRSQIGGISCNVSFCEKLTNTQGCVSRSVIVMERPCVGYAMALPNVESKWMLIVFFNIQGIVHFKFLPQGQTVNQTVYKEILRRLVRSVRDKRRSLWEAHAWTLHHDNAPAHTALNIRQFLAERNIATYSPDLTPCDFFLFPKIKSVLKGTHFSDIDSIKMAATTELKKIPKNSFQECFESWKRRMHKCFQAEGNYFE